MRRVSKLWSLIVATVFVSVSLVGCAQQLDPDDFSSEITVGENGEVLGDEIFDVAAKLVVPEEFAEGALLQLQRREIGSDWATLAEVIATGGSYSIAAQDKIAGGNVAEYRLVAALDATQSPFHIGGVTQIKSVSLNEYLESQYKPLLRAQLPIDQDPSMLIPGDTIKIEYGFEEVGRPIDVIVDLIWVGDDGSRLVLETKQSGDSSLNISHYLDVAENIALTVNYDYVVEIRAAQDPEGSKLVSNQLKLVSHSLSRYIENLMDALNTNCDISGLDCIESHQMWGGDFLDPTADSWGYWVEEFYLYDYTIGYTLVPGSIKEVDQINYVSPCFLEPLEFTKSKSNRYFSFTTEIWNGERFELFGNLRNDGAIIDVTMQPLMCAEDF